MKVPSNKLFTVVDFIIRYQDVAKLFSINVIDWTITEDLEARDITDDEIVSKSIFLMQSFTVRLRNSVRYPNVKEA